MLHESIRCAIRQCESTTCRDLGVLFAAELAAARTWSRVLLWCAGDGGRALSVCRTRLAPESVVVAIPARLPSVAAAARSALTHSLALATPVPDMQLQMHRYAQMLPYRVLLQLRLQMSHLKSSIH